jgi:hypothetical protein
MHKNTTKYNETLSKWCKNKHGASKIIDTLETYQALMEPANPWIQRPSFPRTAPIDEVLTRQCPCLGLSIHGAYVELGGFDGFR